jgi:hypothetical protein
MAEPARQFDENLPGNADSATPGRTELKALEGGGESSEPNRSWYKGDKKEVDQDSLADLENSPKGSEDQQSQHENPVGSGYTPSNKISKQDKKSARKWLFTKRRAALGGGVIGTIVSLFGFFYFSGPFQFIHIAQLLEQTHLSSQEDQSDERFSRIARYLKYQGNGQAEKTRLGYLGNKYADKIEERYNTAGIKSSYSPIYGFLDGYIIDQDAFNNGDLKDKSKEDVKKYFKDTYAIDIEEQSGKLWINADNLSGTQGRKLREQFLRDAGYSKISAAIQARLMGKRAGVDWHPIKKLDNKILKTAEARLTEWRKQRTETIEKGVSLDVTTSSDPQSAQDATEAQKQQAANDANSNKSAADSALDEASQAGDEATKGNDGAISKLQDSLHGKLALGGASAAGVLCIAKGFADKSDDIKQKQVYEPLIRTGMEAVTLGNQVMHGGSDVSTESLGFYSKLLNGKDSKGKSTNWFQAKTFQDSFDHPNGIEADKTLLTINKGSPFDFMHEGAIAPVAGAVCSGFGQAAQLAISFFGGPVSALVGLAVSPLIDQAVLDPLSHWMAGKAIDPNATGAKYGNYLNYGVKLAANDMAIASGGRKLSNGEVTSLKVAEAQYQSSEFNGHSLVYRLFDPYDHRSGISQIIDRASTDPMQNINNTASFLLNFNKLFNGLGNIFTLHTLAASNGYNYPFPTFGFSKEELNDARIKIPQQIAEKVVTILEGPRGSDFIDKANKCFSVSIDKDSDGRWEVTSDSDNVTVYSKIENENCGDASEEWFRIRTFIADSEVMESNACYDGDDEACSKIGMDTLDASASPTGAIATNSGTLPTGDAKDLATQLKQFVNSGKIKCLTSGCPDIINTSNGTSIKNASCYVDAMDPQVLGMLLKLVQDGHTFILSAMCTDHPTNPTSFHHKGKAVDFNTIDGVFMGPLDTPWTSQKIEVGKKLDQDIASFMPKSTGFGQEGGRCHPHFNFLSGFSLFDDLCHHQHIQVP